MKALVFGLVAAASLFMLAYPHDVAADCRERISLTPPSQGDSIEGVGRAEIRSSDAQQSFTVDVDVDVPDGTPLFVFVNGEPAGMITFIPGNATLELSNTNGARLPSGVDPVCSIGPVAVTDADGTTILFGSF